MRKITTFLALATLFSAQTAFAGFPTDVEQTCPIGAEKFTTTGTASCSTMGTYLSLRRVTSCDFVTPIPQCPSNKLPMYKEFSEKELPTIKAILESHDFQSKETWSPFYLSAYIEGKLPEGDKNMRFYLLKNGLDHLSASSAGLDEYHEEFQSVANTIIPTLPEDQRPFYAGAFAYYWHARGETFKAKTWLKRMETMSIGTEKDYLKTYLSALQYCISGPAEIELCDSEATIRDHEERLKKK